MGIEVDVCGMSNAVKELLSQSEVILKLLNDSVTFTPRALEFPAVHNLHRTRTYSMIPFFSARPPPGSQWIGLYPSWSQ